MHHGIDYATPSGTPVTVDGTFLTTWNDPGGGGISSQYAFVGDDGRKYEAILMHGSGDNKILTSSFIDDGQPVTLAREGVAETPSLGQGTPDGPSDGDDSGRVLYDRQSAKERVAAYKSMSKGELDSMYDQARKEDPVKARNVGLEMHRAYFNK